MAEKIIRAIPAIAAPAQSQKLPYVQLALLKEKWAWLVDITTI